MYSGMPVVGLRVSAWKKMRSLLLHWRWSPAIVAWAQKVYGLIQKQKAESLNPVHQSAGFLSALQKSLRAICRSVIVLCCLAVALSPFVAEGGEGTRMSKEKTLGQIFTPDYLVRDILDIAGYNPTTSILRKHVIDNSCGDGAFLTEVVLRYCRAAKGAGLSAADIKTDLETYIHGIELDEQAFHACLLNLNAVVSSFSPTKIEWDVKNTNTLDVADAYSEKMDYVIGNPPYVRVHNLEESFGRVKQYSFCIGGMTDLYLVFYEIGLQMLKKGGKLCYIAPSSWFNSLAGHNMREFARESGWLREIVDLGHFQPFNATTYTAIVLFEKTPGRTFAYKTYNGAGNINDVATLDFEQCYFDDALYLGDRKTISNCRKIKTGSFAELVEVKNGFATLADNVFIADDFPFEGMVIPVIKASTGQWRKAFYPYDKAGKPLPTSAIFADKLRSQYLEGNKDFLLKGRSETDVAEWFLYGRTQALKDVWKLKYSVNTVVRDIASIKMNKVDAGAGVYSGLYILSQVPEEQIRDALFTDEFIKYIQVLRKYKSGGYYTFSSKDLKQFLNYRLSKTYVDKTRKCCHDRQRAFEF